MLTKEKWQRMSEKKKERFITAHYKCILKTIAIKIAILCENNKKTKFGLSFADNPWIEFKILPTWYPWWDKTEYIEVILDWLEANYTSLLWDWESHTGTPALHYVYKLGRKYRIDDIPPIVIDTPELFRMA